MKKMWIGLLGMIAVATMVNADGMQQGGLIAGKDIFPPQEEGVIEADEQDGTQSDDSSEDQAEKEYLPEAQNKKKNN